MAACARPDPVPRRDEQQQRREGEAQEGRADRPQRLEHMHRHRGAELDRDDGDQQQPRRRNGRHGAGERSGAATRNGGLGCRRPDESGSHHGAIVPSSWSEAGNFGHPAPSRSD